MFVVVGLFNISSNIICWLSSLIIWNINVRSKLQKLVLKCFIIFLVLNYRCSKTTKNWKLRNKQCPISQKRYLTYLISYIIDRSNNEYRILTRKGTKFNDICWSLIKTRVSFCHFLLNRNHHSFLISNQMLWEGSTIKFLISSTVELLSFSLLSGPDDVKWTVYIIT